MVTRFSRTIRTGYRQDNPPEAGLVSTLSKQNNTRLPWQDLEEPPDQWIEQKDRSGRTFYTNPATGSNETELGGSELDFTTGSFRVNGYQVAEALSTLL